MMQTMDVGALLRGLKGTLSVDFDGCIEEFGQVKGQGI